MLMLAYLLQLIAYYAIHISCFIVVLELRAAGRMVGGLYCGRAQLAMRSDIHKYSMTPQVSSI